MTATSKFLLELIVPVVRAPSSEEAIAVTEKARQYVQATRAQLPLAAPSFPRSRS